MAKEHYLLYNKEGWTLMGLFTSKQMAIINLRHHTANHSTELSANDIECLEKFDETKDRHLVGLDDYQIETIMQNVINE